MGKIPEISWAELQGELVARMEPGQHMAVLGTTGTGKTTFLLHLLELLADQRRSHVVAIGTKARDRTLKRTGWPIIKRWPPNHEQREGRRVILWPPYSAPSTAGLTTAGVISDALDEIMMEGAWRIGIDELAYLTETLGLRSTLDEYWNGARSSRISLIGATQRPTWLPRSAVSQVDWVVCFRINDVDDRTRAAEILGDRKRFMGPLADMSKTSHDFLIAHEDFVYRCRLDL